MYLVAFHANGNESFDFVAYLENHNVKWSADS
jgi:hypothetical protein